MTLDTPMKRPYRLAAKEMTTVREMRISVEFGYSRSRVINESAIAD